ncbi:hypothetical protein QCA50_020399 [Cerrena zonata]|uniref:Heterokaryon incompatibility domain-containing protein n=1 Tax=Cerrena zonata TaxID=2478898 RepID=A0AAW0FCP8_9APHY
MSEAQTLFEALTAPVVDILEDSGRLCREDSRPKGLLPIIICLLSPPEGVLELDHQITLFKQDVLDPCSQDPIILAFRDAIALIGSDISPQWESVVQSLRLPMIEGPRRGMGGDSFPRPIINLKVKSSLQSISAYEISLRNLKFTVLDTSYAARPRTFRLLDCKKYVEKEMLVIHEYRNIPSIPYATVSYPWVGVACRFDIDNPTFRVKQDGGRDGDPISINVLGSACLLALREGLQFLWLDRLCISQLDREDKPWQIHRMCKVFKQCCLCIILPGGLQCIARLYEETPWIKRMWTLQEAILPPKGFVVYNRQELKGRNLPIVFTPLRLFNYYHPVLHDESLAMATIPPSTVTGFSPLKKFTRMYVTEVSFKIRLLGRPSAGYARLLYNALSSAATSSQNRKYQQYLAIWESAITRSSDRPRDLLLSTMGIFDIELEEGEQRSEESVFAAFVKEFRKEGHKGARITAFRVAVSKAHASVSVQWRQFIDDLYHSFPLLDGGISPAPDYGLPPDRTGPAIFVDGAGHQVFLGSALLVKEGVTSLQPCPIIVSTPTSFSCRVPSDDLDREHNGHWELLPFDPERMEWVSPCDGFVPPKRTPVEGGYEMSRNGQVSLYYALTTVVDEWGNREEFIGKAGRHFQGSVYRSGSDQHIVKHYLILCWKDDDQGETREEWKASLSDFESESEDGRLTLQ